MKSWRGKADKEERNKGGRCAKDCVYAVVPWRTERAGCGRISEGIAGGSQLILLSFFIWYMIGSQLCNQLKTKRFDGAMRTKSRQLPNGGNR